jgi:diguanylate cyclase (GGDEF)-like protein
MTEQLDAPRLGKLDRYIMTVIAAAVAGICATVLIEHAMWRKPANWSAVVIFAAILIVGEMHSVGWLRLHGAGEVTPGWAFAFALLLLGSPVLSMVAMATASVLADLIHSKGLRRTAFNAAQTVLALFAATVILTLSGAASPLTVHAAFPPGRMAATIAAAVAIFVTNSVLACTAIALNLGIPIRAVLRRASALSMSADGALLVLSPLFVIAADFSLVTVPLLVLIAFLVYHSACQALEREHRSGHDHLTSLITAPAFHDHVNSHLTASRTAAARGCVLLLDLDEFKSLNDRLGHQIGDDVLRTVGELLTFDALRGVVAARLGGDEFAVFFPDVSNAALALSHAHELADRLRAPMSIKGFPISTSASIGVALLDRSFSTSEEILRHADLAMYRAKRNRTSVELHVTQQVVDTSGGRISLLADLVHALDRDELWLAYQPQVRVSTGKTESFEALLRWEHPTLGSVMPNEFIGLAEHTDLIDSITERVLQRACTDAGLLRSISPDVRVSINVSTRNLRHRHFPATVLRILSEHNLPPSVLEIELTESAFAPQQDVASEVIDALRGLGVALAMDDFGSGYSSFSRLLNTPADALKIDQTLIQHMTQDHRNFLMIRTVIDLCSALGLTSTAEGVEDVETFNQLRALGCDLVQGYGIARPMAVADAVRWLVERPAGVAFSLEEIG